MKFRTTTQKLISKFEIWSKLRDFGTDFIISARPVIVTPSVFPMSMSMQAIT